MPDQTAAVRPPYPSDEVLLKAGRAAFDWVLDTNECQFCDVRVVRKPTGNVIQHDSADGVPCPFAGVETPA